MKQLPILTLVVLLTTISTLSAQNNLSLFVSGGYTNHLTREGLNNEIGADYEVFKQLDVAIAYRYNCMYSSTSQVVIDNTALYLSWIIIHRKAHRLMIGPGILHGNYFRNDSEGIYKNYSGISINPLRIQYDYSLKNRLKFGAVAGIYGDDGDGTNYIGIIIGYKLY